VKSKSLDRDTARKRSFYKSEYLSKFVDFVIGCNWSTIAVFGHLISNQWTGNHDTSDDVRRLSFIPCFLSYPSNGFSNSFEKRLLISHFHYWTFQLHTKENMKRTIKHKIQITLNLSSTKSRKLWYYWFSIHQKHNAYKFPTVDFWNS